MKGLRSSFWVHSVFYTLLQRFSLMFFNALAFMLIVRAVAKTSFAIWALYVSIYLTFEVIKQGLLRNPTIKFLGLTDMASKKSEIQAASLVLNITFSLLAILVLLFLNHSIVGFLKMPGLEPVLWWIIPYIMLLIPWSHAEIMLQANFQFRRIFTAYFIRQGLFCASIIYLYLFAKSQLSVAHMVILQVSCSFLGMIIMVWMARPYLVPKLRYEWEVVRNMFHFGKYIFGTNIFFTLTRSLDQFITANALPDPQLRSTYVSYYGTVARINALIDAPSLAAADVLFPKNVKTLETEGLGQVKYYFERMIGSILCVILPLSLIIFFLPKLILLLLAGKEYLGAAAILQLTILFGLVRPLGFQFSSTLDAIGRPKVNFWINFLFLIINLLLNYFLLIRFGGMGAAYATIIFYIISFFVMIGVLKKYIHVELGKIFQYMLDDYARIYQLSRRLRGKNHGSEKSHTERA